MNRKEEGTSGQKYDSILLGRGFGNDCYCVIGSSSTHLVFLKNVCRCKIKEEQTIPFVDKFNLSI